MGYLWDYVRVRAVFIQDDVAAQLLYSYEAVEARLKPMIKRNDNGNGDFILVIYLIHHVDSPGPP